MLSSGTFRPWRAGVRSPGPGVWIAALALFAAVPLSVGASDSPDQGESGAVESARRALEASGLKDSVMSIRGAVDGSLNARRPSLDADVYGALERSMRQSFDEERLLDRIARFIGGRLSAKELRRVRRFYESDTGKNVVGAHRSRPPGRSEVAEFMSRLEVSPPDDERVRLIQEINARTRSAEVKTFIVVGISKGIVLGLEAVVPGPERTPAATYDSRFGGLKSKISTHVAESEVVSMLYRYRELSRRELRRYHRFLTSGTGGRFHSEFGIGLDSILTAAARDAGDRTVRKLASQD